MSVLRQHRITLFAFAALGVLLSLSFGRVRPALEEHYTPESMDRLAGQCAALGPNARYRCLTAAFELVLRREGLAAALRHTHELYTTRPAWATDCHRIIHLMGKAAFLAGIHDWEVIVQPETAFCDFGFYHDYIGTMVEETGDLAQAKRFCAYAEGRLVSRQTGIYTHCYHAIGHGLTHRAHARASPQNADEWVRSIAVSSLRICEELSPDPELRLACSSGVYDSIQDLYLTGVAGLAINRQDPLWLCREQPEPYRFRCYGNLKGLPLVLAAGDIRKAGAYIERIPENEHARGAMHAIALRSAQRRILNTSHDRVIKDCRALEERLRAPCITGFAAGLLLYGPVDQNSLERALGFCRNTIFTEEERNACRQEVINTAEILFEKK